MGTIRISEQVLTEALKEKEDENKYSPIPDGEYLVQITNVEEKNTKSHGGVYLKFEYTVCESSSPYYKRKIWDNINIVNKSEVAVSIGLKKLAQIGRCCNIKNLSEFNTTDFLGNILYAQVIVDNNKEFGPTNKVKSVRLNTHDGLPF